MAQTDPQVVIAIVTGSVAILSSVATLITTHILKNSGKLIFVINSVSIKSYKSDGAGGQEETMDLETTEIDCVLEADIFNSSDTPKSLRAITIELVSLNSNQTLSSAIYIPQRIENPTGGYGAFVKKELHVLNFPPKEMVRFRLQGFFNPKDLNTHQGKLDFYFQGKFPNGKIFRKKILKLNINTIPAK